MMTAIRKFLYTIGFRPLHDDVVAWQDDVISSYQRAVGRGNRQLMLFDSDSFSVHDTQDTIETLYNRMQFCIFCGTELDIFILDIKECPKGCSRSFPHDDSMGLPVITTEPIGD